MLPRASAHPPWRHKPSQRCLLARLMPAKEFTGVQVLPVPYGSESSISQHRDGALVMGRGPQQHRDPRALKFIPALARMAWGGCGGASEFVSEPGSSAYRGQDLGPTGS